jgi:ABC-type multidrug transport system ATPase subunit
MALQTTHTVTPAVVFQGVFKYFHGTLAVHGLDLPVPSGCLYALLGANGAGKTTALRMIIGLEKPDVGFVHFTKVGQ